MPKVRTRYPKTCQICNKDFLATSNRVKCCSRECVRRSSPQYVLNTHLVETAEFYLSLNFTPAQVYADFIRDTHSVDTFVRVLERRKLYKLANQFRALAPRPDGRAKAQGRDAVAAA